MEQVKDAPEAVVLTIQKEIYILKNRRTDLQLAVEKAELLLKTAREDASYNELQIRECCEFLQDQCPEAVKHGTWFDEMDIT